MNEQNPPPVPPQRTGPAMMIPFLDQLRSRIRAVGLSTASSHPAPGALEAAEELARERVLNLELEQLPYSLGAAYDALLRIEHQLWRLVAAEGSDMPGSEPRVVCLLAGQTLPIAWSVDQFLDAARRAQNALTRYVARVFRTSIPNSLSDFAKHVERYSLVPDSVRAIVTQYWASDGLCLKQYRDLAQHHVVVSSDGWVHVGAAEGPTIHLLLPTNPGEKSLARITYGPPHVHVGAFCRSAFVELFSFSYRLAYALLRHLGVTREVTVSLMRHPFSFGQGESFAASPQPNLDDLLWQARKSARAQVEAEFGSLEEAPLVGTAPPPGPA
jgi:hypothetical protein